MRRFGRFALVELLGRSELTMVWRVVDARFSAERVLVLPRRQPADAHALARWQSAAGRAARLRHPALSPVLELGDHEHWPFALYGGPADQVMTAGAQQHKPPLAPREAAWACQMLCEALAYAHESGTVHGDVQLQMLVLDGQGRLQLMGLEVASQELVDPVPRNVSEAAAALAESDRLRSLRGIAKRDVQSAGLVLFSLLSHEHPLQEPDLGKVMARMPPLGRDALRLPWQLPRPVPDALRAMANRAVDRQERQRYASARTLAHALEGWRRADEDTSLGPLAILMGRLSAVGLLPAAPGGAERAARLALMERERTSELAEVVMQDLALTFELLRLVNTAQVRGAQLAGSGPVLTVRRAIALLGLNGVRRAALALRAWPGPLSEADAIELQRAVRRAHRAAALAQALRPGHWDGEVVALVTHLQSLGPLLIQYHLPDDARQIRRLTQEQPATEPDAPPQPGMGEQEASFAVLGVDGDAVGAAIVRQWGLDESVSLLMRRWPRTASVPPPDSDDAFLRTLASCAHETIEAAAQPAARVQSSMARVAQRYARALHVTVDMLRAALASSSTPAMAGASAASRSASQAKAADGPGRSGTHAHEAHER